VTWTKSGRLAGDGYFLLGDAATVLDPACGHGVLRAIMSGMQAAHFIVSGRTRGIREPVLHQAYNDWMTNWMMHDMVHLREFYGPWAALPTKKILVNNRQ
jgi:flavin-dependent dehydrogenase